MRNTSWLRSLVLALAILALPVTALAHKVTIFAYVDGANIVTDCFYSGGEKVNAGKIIISDAKTGEELAQATTDAKGASTIPLPAKAVAAKHDIKLVLVAGEGHQNETLVKAAEYASAPAPQAAAPAAPAPAAKPAPEAKPEPAASAAPAPAAPSAQAAAPAGGVTLDEAALTRVVEAAMDRKLAPVKQMLVASSEKGVSVTEVLGGIGYIFGLCGVAAYVASRKKEKSGQ